MSVIGTVTREQMTGNRGTVLAHILIKFNYRIEKSSENKGRSQEDHRKITGNYSGEIEFYSVRVIESRLY